MIIGHQKIIEFLNKSIASNRLAHAYLFLGQEHLGKRVVALEFAKALQCGNNLDSGGRDFPVGLTRPTLQASGKIPSSSCTEKFFYCNQCISCREISRNVHPDVLLVEPEIIEEKNKKREQEIGIDKIRDIQRQVSLFSFRGGYKIAIINSAEKMTRQAANALLKTLEEPNPKTIFILISAAPQNLLPTIISRCLMIKFSLVKSEAIEKLIEKSAGAKIPKTVLAKITRLSSGRPGLAIDYLNQPELVKVQEKAMEETAGILRKDLNFRFQYAENLAKDLAGAQNALNNWLFFFRDLILAKIGCSDLALWEGGKEKKDLSGINNILKLTEIARKIIETKKNLANPSFNARIALETLMLSF